MFDINALIYVIKIGFFVYSCHDFLKIIGLPWPVQWLRLPTPNAGGVGSIPGQGTKIQHAARCNQNDDDDDKYSVLELVLSFSILNRLDVEIFEILLRIFFLI